MTTPALRHVVPSSGRCCLGVLHRRVSACYPACRCASSARQQLLRTHRRDAPNALMFDAELLIDGRTLERPVNFGLAGSSRRPAWPSTKTSAPSSSSIRAPAGARDRRYETGQRNRRSTDSQATLATLWAFCRSPSPARPWKTSTAQKRNSSRRSAGRHRNPAGKPALIGNCQAGWQVMMACATASRPAGPHPARRLAAFVLGRHPWQGADALSPAGFSAEPG